MQAPCYVRALEVRHACLQCLDLAICVAVTGSRRGCGVGSGKVYRILQICDDLLDLKDEVGPWTKASGQGEEGGVGPGDRVGLRKQVVTQSKKAGPMKVVSIVRRRKKSSRERSSYAASSDGEWGDGKMLGGRVRGLDWM